MLLYSENKEIITTVNEKIQPAYNENLLSKISRILLKCCTIIRNIENLNSMMAFDETCKILLIKKIKDENPEGEIAQLYEKINAKEDIIQSLFEKTKSYNFYSIYDSTDKIRIKPQTLKLSNSKRTCFKV